MDRIAIFDTTLRDGEQSPGFSMNVDEKMQMARQLERLQVDVIEAGFPVASEGDFDAVKKIAAEIRSVTGLAELRFLLRELLGGAGGRTTSSNPYVSGDQRHSSETQTQQEPGRGARHCRQSRGTRAAIVRRGRILG